jgi:hypothetical protein
VSFETVVQQVIYDTLSGDAPVSGAVGGRIFDSVPQAVDSGSPAAFPYIVIGDDLHIAWDTDTDIGREVMVVINVWSRHSGRSEAKVIQGLVFDALDRALLTASGYNFVTCDITESSTELDPDGETRHGVQRFRILLQED